MITSKQFDKLKEEYGEVSSWTIWNEPEEGKPKSNIDDLTVFDDKGVLKKLNSKYVFVGLNAANHDSSAVRTWGGFHSEDIKKQQDFKLRYALKDTDYWGSYITDVLKGLPETNSSKVMKYIKKHPEKVKENIERLCDELTILQPECLIALGNNSFKIINDNLCELKTRFPDLVIKKIMHYSCWISKENYKRKVEEILM